MAPVNDGREPDISAMVKEFSGKESRTPRGSLRSLRVSSPVLMIVVVTSGSNPSTLTLGVEVLRVKLGVAETGTAEAARTRSEARMGEKSIVAKVVTVAGGATPLKPCL